MKFEADKDVFVMALSRVKGCTGRTDSAPILGNVLISTEEERGVRLIATDLEISIATSTPVEVLEAGRAAVPAKELLALVREMPGILLSVELRNGRLHFSAGKSRRNIATMPGEDFPMVTTTNAAFEPIQKAPLVWALERLLYTVSGGPEPFRIPGICLKIDGALGRFFGSDGHRMACCSYGECAWLGVSPGGNLVLPRKGVVEALKLLDEKGDACGVRVDDSIMVKVGRTTLTMRLLNEDPPEYEAIIPEELPSRAVVDAQALQAVLKSMLPLTASKVHPVRLVLTENKLTLRLVNGELGEAEDEMDVEYTGPTFETAYNVRYMIEMLQSLGSNVITFDWLDGMHGGVFRGTGIDYGAASDHARDALAAGPGALLNERRFIAADDGGLEMGCDSSSCCYTCECGGVHWVIRDDHIQCADCGVRYADELVPVREFNEKRKGLVIDSV